MHTHDQGRMHPGEIIRRKDHTAARGLGNGRRFVRIFSLFTEGAPICAKGILIFPLRTCAAAPAVGAGVSLVASAVGHIYAACTGV